MSQAQSSWTAEQVLALAPDSASAKAGQGLASPKKWSNLGRGEGMLWGECQGSGASPYQAKADPAGPAFSCSCPSRKFPCKHALGLLLIWVAAPESLAEGAPPSWVSSWKENREKKAEKAREKQEQPSSPVDPTARKKRESARASKVASGLDDLALWLSDLVRQGFASLSAKPASLWTDQARRMVDAQAPGVARRLRQIDEIPLAGDGWQASLLDRLARIHLLIEGFRRLDDLTPELAEDVRSTIGFPADLDAIRDGPGVRDRWQVIGQAVALEDKLTVFRTWLIGRETGRPALVLDYSAAGKPLEMTLPPGFVLDADLAFFPGSTPLRALIQTRHADPVPIDDLPEGSTIAAAFAVFGEAIARNPWLEYLPVILNDVVLWDRDGVWSARDGSGSVMPLAKRFSDGWHLLALGGGGPITLAGEFDGASIDPLSACVSGRFARLALQKEPIAAGPNSMPVMVPLLTEITASAIVGVDRKPPPSSIDPISNALIGLETKDSPARLLGLAAASSLYGRAGRIAAFDDSPLPAPSRPDDRPECSPEAAARLRRMLGGEQFGCFPEFLSLLASSGRRLPHDAIAEVLARVENQAVDAENVREGIGLRGRWLAARNPKWRKFAGLDDNPDPAIVWETGAHHDRLALLRELRKVDPARGRDLVASTFAAEPADRRADFVSEFALGLSMEDEPFLESALDDRGKDVRRIAADLLRRMADSRLSLRMAERVFRRIQWDEGRLVVDLPDSLDKSMVRDGVPPDPIAGTGIGKRAWWLRDMVSATPPTAFTRSFGATATEIIIAARSTDSSVLLWGAWAISTSRHGDTDWAEALLLNPPQNDKPSIHDPARDLDLLGLLPADRQEAYLLARLGDRSLRFTDPIFQQLTRLGRPLGEGAARVLLRAVRAILDEESERFSIASEGEERPGSRSGFDPKYHKEAIRWFLRELGGKLPVGIVDELSDAVAFGEPPLAYYAAAFAETIDLLRFRRDMHREFAP